MLHAYAERLLALNDEALHRVRVSDLTGRIRLGVGDDYAEGALKDVLEEFRSSYPNVALEITVNLSNLLLDQLDADELDVVVAKHVTEDDQRPRQTLSVSPMVWVASGELAEQEFESIPLIVFPGRSFPRDQMIAALESAGRRWHIVSTCHSLAALRASVAAGFE